MPQGLSSWRARCGKVTKPAWATPTGSRWTRWCSAALLKLAFSRARPAQTDNPNEWFQGRGHNSFPSGEVTAITSAVTPFVLEYGAEYPAVYALELLPLYDAIARVKVRAHWQSDVLAAFALGTAAGWYAHGRTSSLTIGVLPGAVAVGWRTRF
jgi:membrane-associated phospholipid phosphatase